MYRVTNAVGFPGEELLFIPFRVGLVPNRKSHLYQMSLIYNPRKTSVDEFSLGRLWLVQDLYAAGSRARKSFHRSSGRLHATPRQIYVLLIVVFLPPCRRAPLLRQHNSPQFRGRYGENLSTPGRSITREGHLDVQIWTNYVYIRRNFVLTHVYIHIYIYIYIYMYTPGNASAPVASVRIPVSVRKKDARDSKTSRVTGWKWKYGSSCVAGA